MIEQDDLGAAEKTEVDAGIADAGRDDHFGIGKFIHKTAIVELAPENGRRDERAEKREADLSAVRMPAKD